MVKRISIVLMVLISIALIGIVNAETVSDNAPITTDAVSKDVNASETNVVESTVAETITPSDVVNIVLTEVSVTNESIVTNTPVIIPLDINMTIVNTTEPEVNVSAPPVQNKAEIGTIQVVDRSYPTYQRKDIIIQEVVPGTGKFTNGAIVSAGAINQFATTGSPKYYSLNMDGKNDIQTPVGVYSVELVGYTGGQTPVYALAQVTGGYTTNVVYI
jgi:hypothetical protein